MAGYYQYPIEHQDDFLGTISFEAIIEPPIDVNIFGIGGNPNREGGTIITQDTLEQFTGGDRFTRSGEKGVIPDGRVTLYMPRALQIQDGVTYDNNFNLGLIGAGVENALSRGASSLASAAANATGGAIESFVSSFLGTSGGDLARLGAVRMAEAINTEVGGAVRSVARVVPNPNTRTLFRGVAMRQFAFDFTLIPNSIREGQEIQNIIRFFRTQMYPEDIGGTATTQGIFGLKFPNKFEIKVLYREKEVGIRFLPCYLTGFSATYNQQGGAMHKDGKWNDVNIQLSFTETRTLVKQDIQAGY